MAMNKCDRCSITMKTLTKGKQCVTYIGTFHSTLTNAMVDQKSSKTNKRL